MHIHTDSESDELLNVLELLGAVTNPQMIGRLLGRLGTLLREYLSKVRPRDEHAKVLTVIDHLAVFGHPSMLRQRVAELIDSVNQLVAA